MRVDNEGRELERFRDMYYVFEMSGRERVIP